MKYFVSLSAILILIGSPVRRETSAAVQTAANQPQEMVQTYCVTCHSTRARMGGLALEGLNPQAAAANADLAADNNALPSQSRHHLDDLYQLGRIGHVRGIQAKLRQMEDEDAANRPFATHLRGLVANFDLKRYMNVLEAMRNHG